MIDAKIPLTHPGEYLKEEFLDALDITPYRLAKSIGVDAARKDKIIKGKRSISPDTALRLSRFFSMDEEFWIRLQAHYDFELAKDKLGDLLNSQVEPLRSA